MNNTIAPEGKWRYKHLHMKSRQLSLLTHSSSAHGGQSRRGRRKIRRPVATKSPMHIVFRSSRARGAWSFLRSDERKHRIRALAFDTADKYGVKLLGYENVGNHIHLIAQVKHRKALQSFLRVLPQKIMFLVTGAKKGMPKGRFFDATAFSRIISWGRDMKTLRNYLFKNTLEALGLNRAEAKNWSSLNHDGTVEPCG